MSDVNNTTTALPVAAAPVADTVSATTTDAPVVAAEPVTEVPQTEATDAAVEETKAEAAPTEEAAAEKAIEPITEGQLAYKGPGLVKSLIPSKKTFWLSDEPVAPQNLDLFMRGEKADVSHAIVAWASQTGKGLLFFNKKNDTDRTHPADVLALYDATDLKKQSPHEFSLKLNGSAHTFKATSDAERDGWYMSVEKAIELGKASKEEIRESEGYKAEMEKLNKPNTAIAAAAAKRSQSQPKKSMDADKAVVERTGSSSGDEDEADKKKKSRSTSRGMFNRLKGKKEEVEQKVVEKKEEKEVAKEEKKAEEAAPVADSTEAAPVIAATTTADIPTAGESLETSEAKPVEETPIAEEKPKASKRGSIFGRVSSTLSGMRSPAKEKDLKDAELAPETPAKDAVVSENPPVLPETATTEPVTEPAVPVVEEPATEVKTEAPKEEVATPGKEKTNFLSGLGFMKRNRSVSPSTAMKEAPKKEETPIAASEEVAQPVAAPIEEPVVEPVVEGEKPVEKVEEPKTETSTPNKRQSMLGSLGRRASKALNRMQAPKKEAPASAATEAKKEETTEAKAVDETPVVAGEAKTEEAAEPKSIGDVVPDAVTVGQPQHSTPAVTASA